MNRCAEDVVQFNGEAALGDNCGPWLTILPLLDST